MCLDIRFSILIPVYNAENTIKKCLDSILQQDCNDVEIILVNDGSTDASLAICKEYAVKYSNIQVFSQENKGVSVARNNALIHAIGKYILFIDSDDYVLPDYLDTIRTLIDKHDAPDMIAFSLKISGGRNCVYHLKDVFFDSPQSVAEEYSHLYASGMAHALMTKVFKHDIIKKRHIYFDDSLSIAEDSLFIFRYFLYVQTMATSSRAVYCLCEENPDSLSRKARPYLKYNLLHESKKRFGYIKRGQLENKCKKIFWKTAVKGFYRNAYSCFKELRKFDYSSKRLLAEIDSICDDFKKCKIIPVDFESFLMALPIMLRSKRLIKCFMRRFW